MRRVVLSGCSGAGKTTLINAMAARSYTTVPEPGRRIVQYELARGGSAVPWKDAAGFATRALEMALAEYHAATAPVTLYDRSALDALNWFAQTGTELPARFQNAARDVRYDQVFLVAPWPEIFTTDTERRHDMTAAVAEYEALCQWLPAHGYGPQIIPQLPIPERADWLEAALAQAR